MTEPIFRSIIFLFTMACIGQYKEAHAKNIDANAASLTEGWMERNESGWYIAAGLRTGNTKKTFEISEMNVCLHSQ